MEKELKKKVRKTVTIVDNDLTGNMDEVYCDWYTCPDCGEINIMRDFKFCPHCGKRIRWKS
jgi:hypothetical protein